MFPFPRRQNKSGCLIFILHPGLAFKICAARMNSKHSHQKIIMLIYFILFFDGNACCSFFCSVWRFGELDKKKINPPSWKIPLPVICNQCASQQDLLGDTQFDLIGQLQPCAVYIKRMRAAPERRPCEGAERCRGARRRGGDTCYRPSEWTKRKRSVCFDTEL